MGLAPTNEIQAPLKVHCVQRMAIHSASEAVNILPHALFKREVSCFLRYVTDWGGLGRAGADWRELERVEESGVRLGEGRCRFFTTVLSFVYAEIVRKREKEVRGNDICVRESHGTPVESAGSPLKNCTFTLPENEEDLFS
ncbi:hypothetical protein V1478_017509 [Vespula squamosa]|uniref:Uncharacterized protein n=1 Tax=Vespula squamosa TaxID=30214 RepID=A0ABD1ZX32_VESSQ